MVHGAPQDQIYDRKPAEKLSRSISQIQSSKAADDGHQNNFFMNKRQSYKSIKSANAPQLFRERIQLGSQTGGSHGQRSGLGSQTRSLKKNHEQIMEQIKMQNERNMS